MRTTFYVGIASFSLCYHPLNLVFPRAFNIKKYQNYNFSSQLRKAIFFITSHKNTFSNGQQVQKEWFLYQTSELGTTFAFT